MSCSAGVAYPVYNWTPYTWNLGYNHQYKLTGWNWPKTIAPHSGVTMCLASPDAPDEGGEATYSLGNTGDVFQFQWRPPTDSPYNDFLYVQLLNMDAVGYPNGSKILAYEWILAGQHGSYMTSEPPVNWMARNLKWLGKRMVREITIPGAHDAGMSSIHYNYPGGGGVNAYNTQTQSLTILGQLRTGARWLDVRVCIQGGTYQTCHGFQQTNFPTIAFWGATGQSLADVVSDINSFTAAGNNELIFVDLSHGFNIDKNGTGFTDAEWYGSFDILKGLNHRFTAGRALMSGGKSLDQLLVSDFIGNNAPAIALLCEGPPLTSAYSTQGFYTASTDLSPDDFRYYNNYADSDDVDTTTSDQITKMDNIRKNQTSGEFLLSWELTMTGDDAFGAGPPTPSEPYERSNFVNANKMWDPLWTTLLPATSATVYPNVILLDNYGTPDYILSGNDYRGNTTNAAAIAIALSYWGFPLCS